MFADHLGANLFLVVVLAAVVAVVLSLPTAALVFRLRGGYFAIGTWVVAEVYLLLIANTQSLGGGSGATITCRDRHRSHDPPLRHVLDRVGDRRRVGPGSTRLLRTRLGLALRAVRDRESAAPTLGVDVRRAKVHVYVLASTVAGLTGAVIYANLLRIQPDRRRSA